MNLAPATFAAYCRFFRDNFPVIPLGALVDKLQAGTPLHGELVVTLDDGYADNHDIAAPILESFGLPATFFLTTGFIGADTVPWWDQNNPAPHPFMTWEQANDLARRGFELGGHTATHQDLGRIGDEDAVREIRDSRDAMTRELGTAPTLFAYPYGRVDAMSPANRALVAGSGYRCCCGGAGAVNETGTDPMVMERFLISDWYRSPRHFLGHVLVTRLRARLRHGVTA